MTRIALNYGSSAGDASADFLFDIFGDVEANFVDLYLMTRRFPGYRSGAYYAPPAQTTSTVTLTANRTYLHPILIQQAVTLANLCVRVMVGAASSNCKLGLYAHNYSTALPGSLLATTAGGSSAGNTSDIDVAIVETADASSNIVLQPGIYWMALISDGIPGIHGFSLGDRFLAPMVGGSNVPRALGAGGGVAGFYTDAHTYAGGLPSSFGSLTLNITTGCPMVGFKVA